MSINGASKHSFFGAAGRAVKTTSIAIVSISGGTAAGLTAGFVTGFSAVLAIVGMQIGNGGRVMSQQSLSEKIIDHLFPVIVVPFGIVSCICITAETTYSCTGKIWNYLETF